MDEDGDLMMDRNMVFRKAGKRSAEVVTLSFSDVEEEEVRSGPWRKKPQLQKKAPDQRKPCTERFESVLRKRKLPKYPDTDMVDFVLGEDSAWLAQMLERILDNEIAAIRPVFTPSHDKHISKLDHLCKKTLKKVKTSSAFRELDKNVMLPKPQPNEKNAMLRKRQERLEQILQAYQNELEEWSRVERDRKQSLLAMSEHESSEDATNEHCQPEKQDELDMQGEEDSAFNAKVQTAIVQLQIANAKLRAVRSKVTEGSQISERVARFCESGAFKSYANIQQPTTLIRAITSDTSAVAQ